MSENQINRLYAALANPYRRKIVELLRGRGRLGFKDLHQSLGISVGALYHHLDMLEGVVGQDSEKKYVLTEQGRSGLDALSVSEERIRSVVSVQKNHREGFGTRIVNEFLLGRGLFNYLNKDPLRSLPLAVIIVLLGGWLSLEANLEPILMFYVNPITALNKAWYILLFAIGWLGTFGAAELFSVVLYHRRGGELSLLTGTAFSMLPLLIVPSLFYSAELFGVNLASGSVLVTLLPILIQAWIVCLLSASISLSKGLRMEKTAVISLGVMYLNIVALIVALQLRVF